MAPIAKVFVSDAILHERLAITPPEASEQTWGWKKLSTLYKKSFAACGYQITPVTRPEIYQSEAAHRILGVEAGDWHLAIKPIEHLRPFHGLPNIFVCNWPFPELATGPSGSSPFFNQARLLGMADAVLCCTEFTTQTLRRAHIETAITLPPVITPGKQRPDVVSVREEQAHFVAVVEYAHLGRQLGPVIEGFAEAAQHADRLRLTICLQGGNARSLSELRQRAVRSRPALRPGLDETISVIGWDESGAAKLRATADFFLCADAAPGLCVPLVEAMLAGLPLVTTMTAGTASFLTPENAVPIATEPRIFADDGEPIASFQSLTANPPTADAVLQAVLVAAALDRYARTRLAEAGREIAESLFGCTAFSRGVDRLRAVIAMVASR